MPLYAIHQLSSRLYLGHSTPNRLGWSPNFFLNISMRPQIMTHTNFQNLQIWLAVIVEISDLALRAVIDSFEIYTINSLIGRKIRDYLRYVQSFIWGSTTRAKRKILLLLLKKVLGHVNYFFNKISSFKQEPLFNFFLFLRWFFKRMMTNQIHHQILHHQIFRLITSSRI